MRKLIILTIFIFFAVNFFGCLSSNPNEPNMENITSLPYLTFSPEIAKDNGGVKIYKKDKCQNGLVLWNSRNKPIVNLMDREGNIVHQWKANCESVQHSELYDNFLYVIVKDECIKKLDKDSKEIWSVNIRCHHDMDFGDGIIYLLTRKNNRTDYISILNQYDGSIFFEYCIKDFFKYSGFDLSGYDPLHTNSIQMIDDSVALLSFKNINSIGIIDFDNSKFKWLWGDGILSKQHHATMLPNNHITIFDNSVGKSKSRVVEIDENKNIYWKSDIDMHSPNSGGSVEMLSNGNYFICSSNEGRILEITKDNEIVWEFLNPDIKDGYRATIYRAIAIL